MRFSGVSALAIWNNVIRTLTGFGTTALIIAQSANVTVAANATVNFAQTSGKVMTASIVTTADATGSVVFQISDLVNTYTTSTVAAGTTAAQDVSVSSNNVFWQIHNNSATVAAKYAACGQLLSQ